MRKKEESQTNINEKSKVDGEEEEEKKKESADESMYA